MTSPTTHSTLAFQEKALYHQILSLKLLTDIGITFPALYLFWQHPFIVGLIVTFVPSILVSALVMRYANLEPYKESRLGHYIRRSMSSLVVALRLLGLLVMCVGAWLHMLWLIPVGIIIVILAWLRGVIFPT